VTYTLHSEAAIELERAFDFYLEQGGAGRAKAFAQEFARVAMLLVTNPGFGTSVKDDLRKFPLRRFPYSVIYRPLPESIHVLVVAHHHRRPGYWGRRG
jgi:toxin ParE1/3/4